MAASVLAGVTVLGFVSPASLTHGAETRLLTPQAARECICLTRSLERQERDVELRRAMYDERQAALGELDRARRDRYYTIDENDPAAVAAFKKLLARQRELKGRLRRDLLPDYRDAVLRYNETVARFNALCGDASYTEPTMLQARESLDCPAQ